jgi:hypothetical protein
MKTTCPHLHKKSTILIVLTAAVLLAMAPAGLRAAAFTPGDLAMVVAAASANNTTCSVVEINTTTSAQSAIQTIGIAGTGTSAIRVSGSASSTLYVADSNDGTLLCFTGVNKDGDTSSNANTLNPRAVVMLDYSGNVSIPTTYTGGSGNQTRCASTINNTTWFIGDQGGIYSNGSSSASPSGNFRGVKCFGGTAYICTASASSPPVGTVAAATGSTFTALTGLANGTSAVQDFYLISSGNNGSTFDVLYVLSATTGTAGIIAKYSLVSGSWTANSTYTTSFGGFGLCAAKSGSGAVLYVTTGTGASTANSVIKLTDTTGYNSNISITTGNNVTLYTAATGTIIKGIAFAPIGAPTVTASAATAIGTTAATLNGNVTSDGGAMVTDRGFVYSSGVTISDNKTTVSGTTGAFTLTPTLSVNGHYYFKAYAINSIGTTLSSELDFWTLANAPATPTVNNPSSSSLDVVIGSGDGNPATTTYAIHETSQNEYVQADGTLGASAVFQTASVWGTRTVTGLNASSTYTFEVEAQNGGETLTSFGSPASGTTSAAATPTISVSPSSLTFSPVAVGGTSASQAYSVSGLNLTANMVITAPPNFEISTASGSGYGGTLTLAQSGGTVASTNIFVHFKPTAQTAYADNITNVSSGANNPNVAVSGPGANAPSVSTQPASAIGATNSTLNGTVTASNNADITDRGFYWKTSPGVSVADTQVSEGGTTVSSFAKTITGLGANTVYYFRAYAANAIGTTLDSADTTFYTLANPPTAPVVNGATTNTLNVAIGGGDGNPAGTAYAIQETNSVNFVQADGSLGATVIFQTAAAWGTKTVTGLGLGTTYVFQVQATNSAGVATAFGPATSAATANLPFTPGDLAVYRVGDGSAALSSAGTAVFLDEYSTSGTRLQSFPLPTISNGATNALVASGSATSEGLLTRSTDGRYLTFAGYKAAVGTTGLAGSTSAAVPRVVARVDNAGNIDTSTALTDWTSGNNPRGVVSVDGTAFWCGGAAGDNYAELGSTTSTALTNKNSRAINIFNGQLYISSTSGSTLIATVGTGLPTTAGQTVENVPGTFTTTSPDGFVFVTLNGGAGPDTLYVADDTVSSGVIQKYALVGGSWTLNGSITAAAVRGLTASVSGTTVTLFGTTAGSLYTVTDTAGYNAAPSGTTATTIATAGNNTAFRGVAFAPKPAPTFNLASSANPAGYQDSVAFTASTILPAEVTGTIQFTTNGVNLGGTVTISSGSAGSIAAAGLPRGSANVIQAIYSGDANYAAITETLTQTVTNHPPVAAGTNYYRSASIPSLRMAITDLLAAVTDADGDVITLVGTSISTNGITLDNASGCLSYYNSNAVNDQFTNTYADGFGGTNTATITITISTNVLGGQTESFALNSGTHAVTLNFAGVPTYGYAVQRSTNLTDWADILLTNAPAGGGFQFIDNLGGNPPDQLYYRLRYNP